MISFLFENKKGLSELFTKAKIIHRDLKPDNILVDSSDNHKPVCFLADMGSAKLLEMFDCDKQIQTVNTFVGTEVWMAPEILLLKDKAEKPLKVDVSKFDIFSLGLISLYCLDKEGFKKFKNINLNEIELNSYLESFTERVPPNFFYMMRCMLSFNHFTRPSITQLHEHFQSMFMSSPQKV